MKKKKGSSLLLVLGISLILSTVGGVLVTSIISTTKKNNDIKVNDDLVYAAESGLEDAYSKIKNKEIKLESGDVPKIYDINDIFKDQNIKVDIKVSREDSKYKVISKSSNNANKSEVVTSAFNINKKFVLEENNNIFKYILCGKNADIQCAGPLDNYVSLWNIKEIEKSKIVANRDINVENKNIENKDFILPKFKFESTEDLTIKNIGDLDTINKGVKKINYQPKGKNKLTIYLVNLKSDSNILKIETDALQINNTIIITNGIVKVGNEKYDLNLAPPLSINNSTILAKKIEMKISSFHSTYRLIDNKYGSQDGITEEDVLNINKELEKYIEDWTNNTGEYKEDDIDMNDIEYIK